LVLAQQLPEGVLELVLYPVVQLEELNRPLLGQNREQVLKARCSYIQALWKL
jgi:hypothetical protein